jgi:hypothetical protein
MGSGKWKEGRKGRAVSTPLDPLIGTLAVAEWTPHGAVSVHARNGRTKGTQFFALRQSIAFQATAK